VSEPKFTPGPYRYRPQEFDDWGVIRDGRGFVVGTSRNPDARDMSGHRAAVTDPFEGNGHLFASAPALYSLLRRWVALDAGSWHNERAERERAELETETRSALAQARGERP
jgi:hypothetical protein